MVRDKLFIDGELYTLPENTETNDQNRAGYRDIMMTPAHNKDRLYKRQCAGQSPDNEDTYP